MSDSDSPVKIVSTEILSDNWYTLKKVSFEYTSKDGSTQLQQREAYDRGNGAAILLYNREHRSVLLTRQFRMPTYLNGNVSGMLTEVCAGLLDELDPQAAIIKEVVEETGYRVTAVEKIFEAYMSPGSVTELLYFFVAEYSASMKQDAGGGLKSEQEDIEVLELPFEVALQQTLNGTIRDAKTIMLLQWLALSKRM